jgi:hypothetical protein
VIRLVLVLDESAFSEPNVPQLFCSVMLIVKPLRSKIEDEDDYD